ncbi:MAG: pentapeptide repeat-containing protein, partial [Mariniphaga sp.]
VGGCDFSASKFKKSKLKDFHILNSDCSKVSFRDCSLSNHFFLDCNFIKTEFYNCRMDDISFNSTNLAGTFFNNCEINKGNFVHSEENTDWLSETGFVGCRLSGCEFQSPINISTMYFLETNAYDLSLIEDEKFTEIYNKYSNVLYAINSDVVWWKPNSYNKKVGIFRGSLKEFSDEVRNGFPTTDIWPDVEVLIGSELEHVIKYLESWKKRFE